MVGLPQTTACYGCAKAKRRCGKQRPNCSRCSRQGIRCGYPPTKPSSFVLLDDDETSTSTTVVCTPAAPIITSPPLLRLDSPTWNSLEAALSLDSFENCLTSLVQDSAAPWFISKDTWQVEPPIVPDVSPSSIRNMKRHAETIQGWLYEWAETGSNPFLHPQLYQRRFPRCIQDAYATLSCYSQRTEMNKNMVLQIVEERAKELVGSNPGSASSAGARVEPDAFEQLARVQALLVYQVIGLYDGDIRLRYLSERHITVLNQWMKQMISTASQTPCLGKLLVGPEVTPAAGFAHQRNFLWYSWILAESMRRTFLITSGIQGLYLIMQQGFSTSCSGGMMFTTRVGAWEAESASAWEKICSEKNVGLMKTGELYRILEEAKPGDINDFTKMILQTTLGAERVKLWEEEGIRTLEYVEDNPEWQVL